MRSCEGIWAWGGRVLQRFDERPIFSRGAVTCYDSSVLVQPGEPERSRIYGTLKLVRDNSAHQRKPTVAGMNVVCTSLW
jgi:hypothetical protein